MLLLALQYHTGTTSWKLNSCYYFYIQATDFWFNYWKIPDIKHKILRMLMLLHYLLIPSFKFLVTRLLLNCLHAKTQNTNESISNILSMDCPQNIFAQHNYLEMGISTPVIDVIKSFTSMKVSYFTKTFYLK